MGGRGREGAAGQRAGGLGYGVGYGDTMGCNKANYHYYLDRGRCPLCHGKRLVDPGYHSCAECREERNERSRQNERRKRAEGLCPRCGEPQTDGHILCEKCRDYKKANNAREIERLRRIYTGRLEAGKCVRCGIAWAEPGRTACRKCMDKHNAVNKEYDPKWQKRTAKRQERIEAGLCIDCGRPAEEGKQRCQRCNWRRQESMRVYRIKKRIDREIEEIRRANHANR